jgi:hypothetical protein
MGVMRKERIKYAGQRKKKMYKDKRRRMREKRGEDEEK